jgi:hypothetical protein
LYVEQEEAQVRRLEISLSSSDTPVDCSAGRAQNGKCWTVDVDMTTTERSCCSVPTLIWSAPLGA